MTYCDVPSPRGRNPEQADIDDVILFIAHLQRWQGADHGFYLMGGLRVDMFHHYQPLAGEYQERFRNNAGYDNAEECMLFAGDEERSRLFRKAVPLNREICDSAFRDAKGRRFDWTRQGGNETRIIGSYTRTCRCQMDTSIREGRHRLAMLHEWIARYSGEDAVLLGH